MVALTSLAGDEELARGKAAGIDDYQTKLDWDPRHRHFQPGRRPGELGGIQPYGNGTGPARGDARQAFHALRGPMEDPG